MNEELANVALQFLDRVATTGHKERHAMSVLCEALAGYLKKDEEDDAPVKGEIVD